MSFVPPLNHHHHYRKIIIGLPIEWYLLLSLPQHSILAPYRRPPTIRTKTHTRPTYKPHPSTCGSILATCSMSSLFLKAGRRQEYISSLYHVLKYQHLVGRSRQNHYITTRRSLCLQASSLLASRQNHYITTRRSLCLQTSSLLANLFIYNYTK